jgi:putative DNA methylase
MVRAIVLGCLLPVTEDLEADLHIFELLMAMDDADFGRREPKLNVAEIAKRLTLANPWDFFDFTNKNGRYDAAAIESLQFPLDLAQYPGLTLRWQRGLDDEKKCKLLAQALEGLSYEEKVGLCKRPEELDPTMLYGPIWDEVNAHLALFGIEADSHESLVEQLGLLRYGHRPRVGDTFCGGGSIPFEAARLGCDVYASDLNPVACMLTWGAFNIIGASPEKRAELQKAQHEVAEAVDREITELGIEHNERGDRAKAFLYCLETRCPETGWLVPMLPSRLIGTLQRTIAKLVPNYERKCFDIEVVSGVSKQELAAAKTGTVDDTYLTYELDGKVYRNPIRTIRGDRKASEEGTENDLRPWSKADFISAENDVFRERLYCIYWITNETLNNPRQETYFASVTESDLERERKVESIVEKNLTKWQAEGLMPDMAIEAGAETTRLHRERGWHYWHHLFSARQSHYLALTKAKISNPVLYISLAKTLNRTSKLCTVDPRNEAAKREITIQGVFYNQALNTLYTCGVRPWIMAHPQFVEDTRHFRIADINSMIDCLPASKLSEHSDIFITDPPYADAVSYEEIT